MAITKFESLPNKLVIQVLLARCLVTTWDNIHTWLCKYGKADRPKLKRSFLNVSDPSDYYIVVNKLIIYTNNDWLRDSLYYKLHFSFSRTKNSLVEKSSGHSTSGGVRLRKQSVQIWQQSVAGQQHITCHTSKIISKCCGVLGLRNKDTSSDKKLFHWISKISKSAC